MGYLTWVEAEHVPSIGLLHLHRVSRGTKRARQVVQTSLGLASLVCPRRPNSILMDQSECEV